MKACGMHVEAGKSRRIAGGRSGRGRPDERARTPTALRWCIFGKWLRERGFDGEAAARHGRKRARAGR